MNCSTVLIPRHDSEKSRLTWSKISVKDHAGLCGRNSWADQPPTFVGRILLAFVHSLVEPLFESSLTLIGVVMLFHGLHGDASDFETLNKTLE